MAKFTILKPTLYTKQLKESVAFYSEILGFECAAFEEALGWASLQKDSVEIMLAYPNEHIPFDLPVFSGSLYITTDSVDRLWEMYKNRCKVCYDIENFDYGMREFAIYDNNGYLLQFGQQL
ncbi:VOC family protein [Flavobacterium sp. DG1-102-2]|uniref:VOC family protein n=1 Tax=Flavobacterium sp. DG1-102-2 TaxID=3081663 RepID=UPI0029492033|nr:VOC family protein [Flavobacterium sp. DG1-102-2]MDV6169158.1 VOC family protein [Flavobacterium sp. DG1-102-2]